MRMPIGPFETLDISPAPVTTARLAAEGPSLWPTPPEAASLLCR